MSRTQDRKRNVRFSNSASSRDIGAICNWNRLPCDLLFSLRLEGDAGSRVKVGGDMTGPGEPVETVARRCLVGVVISGGNRLLLDKEAAVLSAAVVLTVAYAEDILLDAIV